MTVTASKYSRAENDLYQTEPWVTEALIRHFPVDGLTVWEPAAGNHLMVDVLREHASMVISTDIARYDRDHDQMYDFLVAKGGWPHSDAIITNPPYGKGNRDARLFAEYALTRCKGLVALLLTAKFDFGNTRSHLFRDNAPFAAKIALTDRISWTLDGVTGTEDHAWYVWTEKPRLPRAPVILYAGRRA
ncbi:hypothetical protein EQW76_00695 [Rhizobium sp. rho-13.1]|uniref:hypothetical protein n=1 Tax=Rhizobium sp. rho-13.1 TaxID=2506431 RepID=UPI00115F0724|nr:hypothetical protein [Rhizobium sp. rho-13.1]TQX91290.1 hypothetical protein EQW76_00695 [Rhizobium sp. rho-13.1]